MIDRLFINNFIKLGVVSGLSILVQVLYLSTLARQLDQADFGFQVLVQIGLLFSVMICERGMAAALLVGEVESEDAVKRGFRCPTIIFGCCVSVLYFLYLLILSFYQPAGSGADFYWLIAVTPSIAAITGFYKVNAQLEEDFHKIASMEIIGHVTFLVSIIFFWLSSNIDCIYVGWVLQHTAMLFYISKNKLRFFFEDLNFVGFDRHSLNYVFERSVSGVTPMIDRPVVSGAYGLGDVGVFDNLLKLTLYPSSRIIPVVSRLIEPRLKQIDFNDALAVNSGYRLFSWLLLPFMVPYFYLVGFRSEEVTHIILGEDWVGVAEHLVTYSAFGVVSITTSLGSVFLFASGHSSHLKKWSIASVLANTICLSAVSVLGLAFQNFLIVYAACQIFLVLGFAVVLKVLIKIDFRPVALAIVGVCAISVMLGELWLGNVNIFGTYLVEVLVIGVATAGLIFGELTRSAMRIESR